MEYKTTPLPHQQQFFDTYKDYSQIALLADMGVGKTKMILDVIAYQAMKYNRNRVIVVAPRAIGDQWTAEEIPKHFPLKYITFKHTTAKTVKYARERNRFMTYAETYNGVMFLIINYEAFVKEVGIELVKWFLASSSSEHASIILDEASAIKNPDAKTTMTLHRLKRIFPNSFRAILTGTPAAKSPVDMWSLYNFLITDYFRCSFLAFKHRHVVHCSIKLEIKQQLKTIEKIIDPFMYGKIRQQIASNVDAITIRDRFKLSQEDYNIIANSDKMVRFKNVDILKKEIAPITFAVSKKDCLALPDKIYKVVMLPLSKQQKELITQLRNYAIATFNADILTVTTKATIAMRILQICGGHIAVNTDVDREYDHKPIDGPNAKLAYIKNDLAEIGEQQCIIWAVFRSEIKLLAESLAGDYDIVTMQSPDEREDNIAKFKRGAAQILIANPEVAGYGLNLQNAGIHYWYSRSYKTSARMQAEDRSYRIGVTKSPIYKDLLYENTFEVRVLNALKEEADMNALFVSMEIKDLFASDF
jgi:SNF2 family DNA or RNA helicase